MYDAPAGVIVLDESLPHRYNRCPLVMNGCPEHPIVERIDMLARLIDEAMERAEYEIIEDEGTFWGEIPGFQGVWARHATLEGCRRELREALSDWIALRLRLGLAIPVVADLDLNDILQPAQV
jgi:predicted RNase H-like HicB family nuclease